MRRCLLALLWMSLGWAGGAAADGGGPLLEQLDVTPGDAGARIVVRFGCALRYASHFPARSLDELKISLVPMPGCSVDATQLGAARPAAGNAAGLTGASLDADGSGLVLTLDFDSTVDVAVHPAPDFMGLEVVVSGLPKRRTQQAARRLSPAPAAVPVTPAFTPTRPLPAPAVLAAEWMDAKGAFDRGDYATAVRLLTRLIEYPEHPRRAEAQELLGLARERRGQLAQAMAEYRAYLHEYPNGPAAARIGQRLAALTTLDSRPQVAAVAKGKPGMQWSAYGGWSQDYRRDSTAIRSDGFSSDFLSQSMVVTDGDLALRGRGDRFDLLLRVNGGYLYDLLSNGPGNQARVSLAYADLADHRSGLRARVGRQSSHSGGVLGTFDGLSMGWRIVPVFRLNVMLGYPVESTREPLSTDRQFVSVSGTFSGWIDGLEVSPYFIRQTFDGLGDRRAVGGETRWYAPGRTVVGMVDYDLDYRQLNMALLLVTIDLPRRWTVTTTLDRRQSPFIATRNALSGQTVQSILDLVTLYGVDGVRALAVDRTSQVDTYSLGLSHSIGTRFQWSLDASGMKVSAMPASGGVPDIPGTGMDLSVGVQLIATGFIQDGAVTVLGLRRYDGSTATTDSLSLSSRFPLPGGFRIGPRLRFDQRRFATDGSTQWLAMPSLRLDWRHGHATVELDAGGEFGARDLQQYQEKSTRYWFSLGYRVMF